MYTALRENVIDEGEDEVRKRDEERTVRPKE